VRQFPRPDPGDPDLRSPGRYLLWLAGAQRATVALAAGYGVLCTLAQGLVPTAIGRGIDAGLLARNPAALVAWGAAILGIGIVQAVTGMLRDRCSTGNRFGASYTTMRFITRQAVALGIALPRRVRIGEVVSVGAADVTRVGVTLETTARGSGAVVSIVFVAGLVLAGSWRLGVVVLAAIPLMAWLIARVMRLLHGRQQALRGQQTDLTGLAVDIVEGIRILRGVGGEAVMSARYADRSQRVRRAGIRLAEIEGWVAGLRLLLPGLLVAVIVGLGASYVHSGQMSAGLLVSFFGYAVFLSEQLRRVTTTVDQVTRGLVAARRVTAFLQLEPELTTGQDNAPAEWRVLYDPESGLRVERGEFLGVACASPAEADRLAGRLGRTVETAVRWDGTPLAWLRLDEVRRRILVVDNRARLFSGRLGTELDPTDAATQSADLLWRALTTASAEDIVDALPDGLDSAVVGAGREFSGGQLQRLRLTRALMADPEVLVLVEPTNALDAHTERRIAERLRAHRAGRTTVVFTLSPILLEQTERIVFVIGGAAAADGTHESLLARDDRYRAVVVREVAAP
jgi:ABC-type multidrug transport system fused ATPase/permease subunit